LRKSALAATMLDSSVREPSNRRRTQPDLSHLSPTRLLLGSCRHSSGGLWSTAWSGSRIRRMAVPFDDQRVRLTDGGLRQARRQISKTDLGQFLFCGWIEIGVFVGRFFCAFLARSTASPTAALDWPTHVYRSRTRCITHGQFTVGQLLSAENKKVTHRNFINARYLDSEKRWVI